MPPKPYRLTLMPVLPRTLSSRTNSGHILKEDI
jgi:hypothetical protein